MAENHFARFADELIAVQAIFGEDFMVTSSNSRMTAVSIRLASLPFSFLLCIPAAYPAKAPEIQGTDPLWLMDSTTAKYGISALRTWLGQKFVPGQICLFDILDDVKQVLYDKVAAYEQPQPPSPKKDAAAQPLTVDVAAMQESARCTACLDTLFYVDMAQLRCKHIYCTDCLQRESPMHYFRFSSD